MKLLLIDDHPLVRKGLQFVLSLEKDIEIIGEASNRSEALFLLETHTPDIVLVDLKLGNESGFDIVTDTLRNNIACKFIVLTSSTSEYDFRKAQEVGAYGYVLKEALPEELLYAIRLVDRGRKYYDPGIIGEMMKDSSSEEDTNTLTPREQEVLCALGEGLCNKDIAKKLFISDYTVKKHVSQILAKLGLADRTQAALYVQKKLTIYQ